MISLVIPAYNKEKRIGGVISSYSAYLSGKCDYELIIVCDGTDNTARIVRDMTAHDPHISLLEFKERQGKGGAIVHGLRSSRGDVLAFVDADNSVPPEEFEKLLGSLDGNDCVIASRRVKGAHTVNKPYARRFPSMIFNIIVNLLFNLNIRDTQCGAKLFRKEAVEDLLPHLKTKGFEFDVELLWRLKNRGCMVREVPINWTHDNGSTFSLGYSYSMLVSLIRIRLSAR
jgi:glycosyltransferase involved in cell wall biosynthesis